MNKRGRKKSKDDLRRDPQILAMAPRISLKLIEPKKIKSRSNNTSLNIDPLNTKKTMTWGIEAIKADISQFDGSGVTVAVLDTDIDVSHPAFSGINIIKKNFTTEVGSDIHGHGTHCAGTIFGNDVSNVRIGVARNISRALIGKVLGKGQGSSANLVDAINWAVENGANIISMSLGIDFPGYVKLLTAQRGLRTEEATSLALEAYRANINMFSRLNDYIEARNSYGNASVIIAASGNESDRSKYKIAVSPPAAATDIISVGAIQRNNSGDYLVTHFSNTQCDISAPGMVISSAKLGSIGLTNMNGTSMATLHVAGIAALWAQKELDEDKKITNQYIKAKLIAFATKNNITNSQLNDIGSGIVQAPQ